MATYYVDPTGQDIAGRDGTSLARAWRQPGYAATRVTTSGNIIHENAGTYTISSTVSLSVGVSIEGDGAAVCINNSSVASSNGTFYLASGSNTVGNQHISGISIIGNPASSYAGIIVERRGSVKVYNCIINGFRFYGVRFYSPSYVTANEIYGCTITGCGVYTGGEEGCLSIGYQDGLLVHDNTMISNGFSGNSGDVIKGVDGHIKNMKVYNNTLTNARYGTPGWDWSIEIWFWEGGNEIYNNTIQGPIDCSGTSKGSSTYSVWIYDNNIGGTVLVPKQSSRCIVIETLNGDVLIERNYLHHAAQPIFAQTLPSSVYGPYSVNNITIRYNVMDNIGANGSGMTSGWGQYFSEESNNITVNNWKFYNNTIKAATTGDGTSWGISLPDCGTSNNTLIANNIVYGFGGYAVRANDFSGGTTTINTCTIENNIYYNNAGGNSTYWNPAVSHPGSVDQNNSVSNPPFTSSSNYHLTAARPGVFVASGLTDRDGVAVANPPTIGAYEYGSSTILVTGITVTGAGGATTISTYHGTLQLSAAVLPANATNKVVTWSISNGTGSASINSSGLVTAITNGTVTARATATDGSGIVGSLVLTMSNQVVPVSGIAVIGTGGISTISAFGGTLQLIATITPANATNQTVSWSLVNGTGQATINSGGLVTAISNGTVTASAAANDGSGVVGTRIITISNQTIPVTSVTITGAGGATTIAVNGGTLQMTATVLPANATDKTVVWSVTSGTGSATINQSGLLTAITNGTVTVKATSNG